MKRRILAVLLLTAMVSCQAIANYKLQPLATFQNGTTFDEGASEITAFDPSTNRLFVVNGEIDAIDVLDISSPASPSKITSLTLAGAPNSVAVYNGVMAAVYNNPTVETDNGFLALYSTSDFSLLNTLEVGAVPDMAIFSPDGSMILVANEGEPDYEAGIDPDGSVTVIDVAGGVSVANVDSAVLTSSSVTTLSFNIYDGQEEAFRAEGIRIYGNKAADPNSTVTVGQDLEPEFISVSVDSTTAWVTLQENNALAIIDLSSKSIADVVSLGTKDHNVAGQGLDASDRDGMINITTWPLKGLYMTDAIDNYEYNGHTYVVMANEGDDRDDEAHRIEELTLDPVAFPNAEDLQKEENLGRLEVSAVSGDTDGDGDYDELYSFGSRSFSIRDAAGNLVYDSGDILEHKIAEIYPDYFNCDNDDNDFDSKSGANGPEIESVTLGEINGKILAFVGSEDFGGVFIFDITNPNDVKYESYLNDRNFKAQLDTDEPDFILAATGNIGPEGLTFIPASVSPIDMPLLVVAYEVSGSTGIYAIIDAPEVVFFDGHMHTTHSDGSGSLADIKTVAEARGLDAVFVTNHTRQIDHNQDPNTGMNKWQEIVSTCATLSDDDFMMIPAFEVTGSEGTLCRDHVLAWGVADPYVGPDSLGLAPEEVWQSPRNPMGTGPMFPDNIKAWAKYIKDNGGVSVQAHTSGSTQPEYGVDYIEVWNTSHVKDIAKGALGLGYTVNDAYELGVGFNNMATEGDHLLTETVEFPFPDGQGGFVIQTISIRQALYFATAQMLVDEYGNQLGQWVGVDTTGQTPSGTPIHSWDDLLMMYINGQMDQPTFGVANSDAHNTANINPEMFNPADNSQDYSDVGEAKNGVLIRGEVNPQSLLQSIKGGHLFATTGPSVDITVNGRIMGETLMLESKCDEGASVKVKVNAEVGAVGRIIVAVKIIKNGDIISGVYPNAPTFELVFDDEVISDSYYRVEVTTMDMTLAGTELFPYFFAWSNPIFVDMNINYPDGDTNEDCKVNLEDFADVAKDWLVGVN